MYFESLDTSDPISLRLTKGILRKKYNIQNVQLPYLIRTLKSNIHEIETLEQDRKLAKNLIENPDTSKFVIGVNVTKMVLVDNTVPNQFSTRCKNCDEICHYPCDIQENNHNILKTTRWCTAMTWFNPFIHCTVCQGKCSWSDHEQIKKRAIFKTIKEECTNESLKERYIINKNNKNKKLRKEKLN